MTTHNPRLLGILIDFLNANVFNIEYLKPVLSSGARKRLAQQQRNIVYLVYYYMIYSYDLHCGLNVSCSFNPNFTSEFQII